MTKPPETQPPYANLTLTADELWMLEEALPAFWSRCMPQTRFAAKSLYMRIGETRAALERNTDDEYVDAIPSQCDQCGAPFWGAGDVCNDCFRGK